MDRTDFETNLEARTVFKAATGINIRLTPFDLFTHMVRQSPTQITVSVTVHQTDERRTEVVLTGRGTRLIQFNCSPTGRWTQTALMTVWDAEFERVTYSLFGAGKSPEAWLHAQIWARMAHRVGSDHAPMDNFDRVARDPSTPRMTNHWFGRQAASHMVREALK